jgi:hypothetical protein
MSRGFTEYARISPISFTNAETLFNEKEIPRMRKWKQR